MSDEKHIPHGPEPRSANPHNLSPGGEALQNTGPDEAGRPSEEAAFEAGQAASSHRWLLFLVGGVSIFAGFLAIAMPFVASLTAAFIAGGALVASGIVGLVTAFRRKEGWHVAAAFGLALLSVVLGIFMFVQPFAGILALTTLIIAWFAASGVLRIYYGARFLGEGGGWMIAVGVLSVVVAGMLLIGLPVNAGFVPGILLGVDLILWGAVLLALAMRIGRGDLGRRAPVFG